MKELTGNHINTNENIAIKYMIDFYYMATWGLDFR